MTANGSVRGALGLLAVDEAGEFLLAAGERLVLGHLRGGQADLPFLADIQPAHVALTRRTSFGSGTEIAVEVLPGAAARLTGRALAARPAGDPAPLLPPGATLELASNLALRLVLPDPASASALIELLRGQECLGASRILWLAPGIGGRARFGPGGQRHGRAAGLSADLELELDERGLSFACQDGVVLGGSASAPRAQCALPIAERATLRAGRSRAGAPPFGLTLCALPEGGDLRSGTVR